MARSRCVCGTVLLWKADEPASDEWLLVAKATMPDALNFLTLGGWSGVFCPTCGRLWADWGDQQLVEYVPSNPEARARRVDDPERLTPSSGQWAIDRAGKARELRSAIPIPMAGVGFTQLYHRRSRLETDADLLRDQGWDSVRILASGWANERDMHDALATAFQLPRYYGRNLNALVDCLRDIVSGDYGFARLAAGGVISIIGFDSLFRQAGGPAHALLDVLARASLEGVLRGFPMVTLVQSDDPELQLAPVGDQAVLWNPAEWLGSARS